MTAMQSFASKVFLLGINPCIDVPVKAMAALFEESGRKKAPLPVHGTLNGKDFRQTVVKFRGKWRLYLNALMRQSSGVKAGDRVRIEIEFNPEPRVEPMNAALSLALSRNGKARAAFERLPPSHKKGYNRYLNSLKSTEALGRNVARIVKRFRKGAGKPKKDSIPTSKAGGP